MYNYTIRERSMEEKEEEEPHTPGRAVLPLKPFKRYCRRTSAPLPLNLTNPSVLMTRVRYYRLYQRHYRFERYYCPLPSTTALPVRRERA